MSIREIIIRLSDNSVWYAPGSGAGPRGPTGLKMYKVSSINEYELTALLGSDGDNFHIVLTPVDGKLPVMMAFGTMANGSDKRPFAYFGACRKKSWMAE